MKVLPGLAVLAAAVLGFQSPFARAEPVATVLGRDIDRAELAEAAPARALDALLWREISRHYVRQHGLTATAAELAEVAAYDREFERKDREQRGRKLEELNQRLAGDGVDEHQRSWLEEFRAVLARMARRDSRNDGLPPPDPAQQAERYAPLVEAWKLHRSLYARFGGVVGLTEAGQYPYGARAALFDDYERHSLLRVADPELRQAVLALLAAPPAMAVAPADVDFTPYWRRPIPSSYFPD